MFCGDALGQCPFTERNSKGEGIPAVVVDEEVYRLLPSLLIATVDKFAQMPWKGETQMLFGRVNTFCPRHGYGSPDLSCTESHRAASGLPATRTVPAGPLRPPDLIIQDELHLISGPLGTLVGLYETPIDRLCEWEAHGQSVRPKLVASTASGQKICARHSIILLEPGETAAVNDAGSSGTELLISGPAPTRPSGAEQNAVRQQAAIWAGYRDKGW